MTTRPSAARDGLLPAHPFSAAAAIGAALAIAIAPSGARAQPPEAAEEEGPGVIAEALFLADPLPAGSRDVNLSFEIARGEEDPLTGEADLVAAPRLQLAAPIGERLGFTVDVGLGTLDDYELDAPGAALQLLLRDAAPGRTGFAASIDLYGSSHSVEDTEVGLGFGALRGVGPLGLRATAAVATGVSELRPHLHGGLSAAMALGGRLVALAEVMADVSEDDTVLSLGPTLKAQLGGATALMVGARFDVRPSASTPVFSVQLTRSL